MPKLPVISAKKLLKILLREDFYIHHQTGSHINLRHNNKKHLHLVIPFHTKDLAPKTLKTILVQAEMTVQEFIHLIK